MSNIELNDDPVLVEALSDLEYFKKKLDRALGTDREQIAIQQYNALSDAIAAYQISRNDSTNIETDNV